MIQLQGTHTYYQSGSNTQVILAYPSGIQAGELIMAFVHHAYGLPATTNPGGWTAGPTRAAYNSLGMSVTVWYRVAVGTESGNVIFPTHTTAGHVAGVMFRLSGVNATVNDATATTAVTNSDNIDSPTITTTTANALILYIISLRDNAELHPDFSPDLLGQNTGASGRRLAIYSELKATAGTTTVRNWLSWENSDNLAAITMALRSASTAVATVQAVTATGSAQARVPVVGTTVFPPKATATATAKVPGIDDGAPNIWVFVVAAPATATAIPPFSSPGNVSAVVASGATSQAYAPVITWGAVPANVTAVKAHASGTAYVPKLYYRARITESCTPGHTAYIYDRGGQHKIGLLGPLTRIRWERRRDDVSSATVYMATPTLACASMMGMVHAGRHEMVIYRGNHRVWEGPIVRIGYKGSSIEIEAHDVMHYAVRTTMRNEYDDRYPNNGLVLDRIDRILTAELARKEALDPPINVLDHVQYIYATPPVTDAGTAAHTMPYQYTVFKHVDDYAARGGVDYTVVGRAMIFFDVNTPLGRAPAASADDFIGQPIITEYGMELGNLVAMTDGKGNYGEAGAVDPYYGEWELLFQAYDEQTAQPGSTAPSVAELTSQAVRSQKQSKLPPMVLRIPDNTRLNPNGVLQIEHLVPGIHIPFSAELPGRSLSQMQKLDNMSVEETEDGETIKVTLSPAVLEGEAE